MADKFNLFPEQKKKMIDDIIYFFDKELDEQIGELKAHLVLEFILEEFAIEFYNNGLDDAKSFMTSKLDGIYELEKVKDLKKRG